MAPKCATTVPGAGRGVAVNFVPSLGIFGADFPYSRNCWANSCGYDPPSRHSSCFKFRMHLFAHTDKRWARAGYGAILGVGAPLGWLAISLIARRSEVSLPPQIVYLYMLFGSVTAFAVFGYRRGREEEDLQRMILVDPLTGIFNRRHFWERLESSCRRSMETGKPVGLVLMDINNFKAINDTLGHPAGDAVLISTTRAISRVLRLNECLCRIGGDEFAILLEGPVEAANDVARRVSAALELGHKAFDPARGMAPADVSCGVASFAKAPAQKLYEAADRALYEAKRAFKQQQGSK